jgi:Zn-dependent M28 family amino/carboxypeptidase
VGLALDAEGKPAEVASNDKATAKLTIVTKVDDKAAGTNVVAVLEGTSKKAEAVVFSAHHDHVGRRLDGDVFNGADDNASGTAGLLEIAEAFATGGPRPARSIVFLSVSAEELGLWGSEWFASHPTWPLDKIVADVNIDMIGRAGGEPGGPIAMQVTPSFEHAKYSTIVRDAFGLAERFHIVLTSGDTYYQRSDHYNFAKNGVPVVFFCDGEHPDYHQVTDTADRLDYERMEAVARLAFWTGWNVANDKARPRELGKQPNW